MNGIRWQDMLTSPGDIFFLVIGLTGLIRKQVPWFDGVKAMALTMFLSLALCVLGAALVEPAKLYDSIGKGILIGCTALGVVKTAQNIAGQVKQSNAASSTSEKQDVGG